MVSKDAFLVLLNFFFVKKMKKTNAMTLLIFVVPEKLSQKFVPLPSFLDGEFPVFINKTRSSVPKLKLMNAITKGITEGKTKTKKRGKDVRGKDVSSSWRLF